MGVTGKDIPKGQWSEVELPDTKVKIASVAVDNTGSFCLVVSDKGVVYFGGVNKKGEAGENGKLITTVACYHDDGNYFKTGMGQIGGNIGNFGQ